MNPKDLLLYARILNKNPVILAIQLLYYKVKNEVAVDMRVCSAIRGAKGRWLSNTSLDERYLQSDYHEWVEDPCRAHQRAVERFRDWLKDKAIGRPKATKDYSVEQLEAMGYVGVYLPPLLG